MLRVLELVEAAPLTNILIPGFVDDSEEVHNCKMLNLQLEDIYLEFGERLLRCTSIAWGAYLSLEPVDAISHDFHREGAPGDRERPGDEGWDFCITSVYDLYTNNPQTPETNFVDRVRVLANDRSNLDAGKVAALALELRTGGTVFFDPVNLFGIRLGTSHQLDEWLARRNSHPSHLVAYEEHVWARPFLAAYSPGINQ